MAGSAGQNFGSGGTGSALWVGCLGRFFADAKKSDGRGNAFFRYSGGISEG